MSRSFSLNPCSQESPTLEIVQSRHFRGDLRLTPVERKERRYAVDAVVQRETADASHVRTVHLDLDIRHTTLALAYPFLLDELPNKWRDDLARLAPIRHPKGDQWDSTARAHEYQVLKLLFASDRGRIYPVLRKAWTG